MVSLAIDNVDGSVGNLRWRRQGKAGRFMLIKVTLLTLSHRRSLKNDSCHFLGRQKVS